MAVPEIFKSINPAASLPGTIVGDKLKIGVLSEYLYLATPLVLYPERLYAAPAESFTLKRTLKSEPLVMFKS